MPARRSIRAELHVNRARRQAGVNPAGEKAPGGGFQGSVNIVGLLLTAPVRLG